MRRSIKITVVIILLVLENLALLYIANFYRQGKVYKGILKENNGLTQACNNLAISDNLFSVLEKLGKYSPQIGIVSGKISLKYGDEWSNNPGVGLLFDKGYKLTHKACNSNWELEVPSFSVNKR